MISTRVCCVKDVYIIASMTIVIMVGVWHAIVPAIQFKWGENVASYCDSVAGATLGVAYIVSNVIFVVVIATRVSDIRNRRTNRSRYSAGGYRFAK